MKLQDIIGLLGLGLMTANSLPYLVAAVGGTLPPTILPTLMLLAGISCFTYRSIKMHDNLLTSANIIGLVVNGTILILWSIN